MQRGRNSNSRRRLVDVGTATLEDYERFKTMAKGSGNDIYGHDISSDTKPVAEAATLLEFHAGIGKPKSATEIENNANSKEKDASATFDSEVGKRDEGVATSDKAGDESQQGH